jgi:hypothetical protein
MTRCARIRKLLAQAPATADELVAITRHRGARLLLMYLQRIGEVRKIPGRKVPGAKGKFGRRLYELV